MLSVKYIMNGSVILVMDLIFTRFRVITGVVASVIIFLIVASISTRHV